MGTFSGGNMKTFLLAVIATLQCWSLSAQLPMQPVISSVVLKAGDKDYPLQPIGGESPLLSKSTSSFSEQQADVRTTETSVKLTFKVGQYVRGSVFLVKLDSKKDKRILGKSGVNPNKKTIIDTDIKETEPGVYEVTPKKPLAPGEYGLFTPVKNGLPDTGGTLFDFGIDK